MCVCVCVRACACVCVCVVVQCCQACVFFHIFTDWHYLYGSTEWSQFLRKQESQLLQLSMRAIYLK